MSRWTSRAWLVLGMAGLAGCPKTTTTTQSYKLELSSDRTTLDADLTAVATISVEAKPSGGKAPKGATVQLTTSAGSFVTAGPDGGMGATTTSITLDDNGRGTASFKCATVGDQPAPPGPATILGTLVANGGDVTKDVHSLPAVLTCATVPDVSLISFNVPPAPGATVNSPDRVVVSVRVVEFTGAAAAATVPVSISITGGAKISRTSTGTEEPSTTNLLFNPVSGVVTFFVMYPGDDATGAGGIPVNLTAGFTNRLGAPKQASLAFTYAKAPNNSALRFLDATTLTGTPNILPRGTDAPIFVDMSAGANSTDAITVVVEVTDRSGQPARTGTPVTFSCSGTNTNSCNGFEGISPNLQDAGVVSNLANAIAFTVDDPATADHPARSVARIPFKANTASTPGTAVLSALATLPGGTAVRTQTPLTVNFVDNSTVAVSVNAVPLNIESNASGTITVSVRQGTSPLANREVCFSLDNSSQVRARLSDGADDVNVTELVAPTDTSGTARATLTPISLVTRGPVTVTVTVVNLDYDNATDLANGPCRSTDPSAKVFTQAVQITRQPILSSMVFVSASPSVLGTRGSSLATTSRVTFQVFNDENLPVSGLQVSFDLGAQNRDPTASVTPFGLTDVEGKVVAFLSSGDQAASLVVRATATQNQSTVTSVSDPVAVVGGKPAWASTQIGVTGSYRVFAGRSTTGYGDRFGPNSRPLPTDINVQLVDRFSNRVNRAGYQVQFRAETGSIPNAVETDAEGAVVAPYQPGPPFSMESSALFNETRQSYPYVTPHQDTPQAVYRVGNRRDGNISILVATRGEESFVDSNGDGQRQASEPFTDLPEPFLDKNSDGLRASCAYGANDSLAHLPVHHDLAKREAGIGTYCNPFFDDPLDMGIVAAGYDVATCRAQWCPDWDPQWNCTDTSPNAHNGQARPRTPEAQRVLWCPQWRYLDTEVTSSSATPPGPIVLGGVVVPLGVRNVEQGYVFLPGVTGIVPQDSGPRSLAATDVATLAWSASGGTYGSFTYRGPAASDSAGNAVAVSDALTGNTVNAPSLELTSTQGAKLWVSVDRAVLAFLKAPLGRTGMTASFRVVPGDQRSPFDDFARDQLIINQTDQFIDGNNNGIWDDVNGEFDQDTLIWKQLELEGSDTPYFNNEDWRYPGPTVDGHAPTGNIALAGVGAYPGQAVAGPVVLYDRLHSFVHVVADGLESADTNYTLGLLDTVDPTNHSGNGDYFVHPGGGRSVIRMRIVDANGVAVCPYDTGTLSGFILPDGDKTAIQFSNGECNSTGVFEASLLSPGAAPCVVPVPNPNNVSCHMFGVPITAVFSYEWDTHTGATSTIGFAVSGLYYITIPY